MMNNIFDGRKAYYVPVYKKETDYNDMVAKTGSALHKEYVLSRCKIEWDDNISLFDIILDFRREHYIFEDEIRLVEDSIESVGNTLTGIIEFYEYDGVARL